MSGYGEAKAIRRFSGKGLAGFLKKPISSATSYAKMAEALDRPRNESAQPIGNIDGVES